MLNLTMAEVQSRLAKSDSEITATEADLEGILTKIINLNQLKRTAEDTLIKERREQEAAQKALILVKGVPRSVSQTRNRLLRKMGQVVRRDITIAKKEELESEIDTLKLELQELCTHTFIYYQSGYEGDSTNDYENRCPEHRYCIICGFSEKGKSAGQYDYVGTRFETLVESDDRIIEEERYLQSEPVDMDIWVPLGVVLKPLEEFTAKVLDS